MGHSVRVLYILFVTSNDSIIWLFWRRDPRDDPLVGGGGQHWGEGGQRGVGVGRVMVRLSASSEDEEDDLPALIPDFHDEEDTGQLIYMPTNLQTTPQNLP